MKSIMDENAQAAVIYLYVVGIVMGLAIYIYMMPVMDDFNAFHYGATAVVNALYPISQNRQDAIYLTQMAFRFWIIIYFVGITIAAYATALRYRSGAV